MREFKADDHKITAPAKVLYHLKVNIVMVKLLWPIQAITLWAITIRGDGQGW